MYTGSWGDFDGLIRCQLGEAPHYELGEELEPRREAPVFDKPNRGTSVEKFREMVLNHLKVWTYWTIYNIQIGHNKTFIPHCAIG